MITISLIILKITKPVMVEWHCVPNKNDYVFYKEKKYQVSQVWHSIDLGLVRVFLIPVI